MTAERPQRGPLPQPDMPPGFVPQAYPLWAVTLGATTSETTQMTFYVDGDPERVIAWITRYKIGGSGGFFDLRPVTTERVLLEEIWVYFGDTCEAAEAEAERAVQAMNRGEEERVDRMR